MLIDLYIYKLSTILTEYFVFCSSSLSTRAYVCVCEEVCFIQFQDVLIWQDRHLKVSTITATICPSSKYHDDVMTLKCVPLTDPLRGESGGHRRISLIECLHCRIAIFSLLQGQCGNKKTLTLIFINQGYSSQNRYPIFCVSSLY